MSLRQRTAAVFLLFFVLHSVTALSAQVVQEGLILDLNADKDVDTEDENRVYRWDNQVTSFAATEFVKRNKGRSEPGSGRPTLVPSVDDLNGHNTIVFRRQELINHKEDAFDHLTTGSGYTWVSVMTVLEQHPGLEDVNSFFGNLRNGGNYEGLWAGFNDDNTIWMGTRNGQTFGRWDKNNPKVVGPRLEVNQYEVVAGRMEAGTGNASLELFVGSPEPVVSGTVPVNPDADPSKMAIGQERDAVNHPGKESFDGKITRFLIYERPLSKKELQQVLTTLQSTYGLSG